MLRILAAALLCATLPAKLHGQTLRPETVRDFEAYVQSAEKRMQEQKLFLLADAQPALNEQLVRGQKIMTALANGPNPHKIAKGQLYDWIASIFIPGTTLERTLKMLQDYDHRPQYFPEVISASKLLCRTGDEHFRFTMRMKEPAVIDSENDVVWERVDPHRYRCRSYSTKVQEIGKEHGYLLRLYSYWRFAEVEKGVYVQAESITLSNEFSSVTRALGSMVGINPEKSLKKTLAEMKESLLKPGAQFPGPASGLPECGEPFHPGPAPVTQR
jgi:hypothetical protein